MILVVGGKNQGKVKFVEENFPNLPCFMLDEFCKNHSEMEVFEKLNEQENLVVVSTLIGCGLVPIEKSDREFRDRIGEIQCQIAKESERVFEVVCGIGRRIK